MNFWIIVVPLTFIVAEMFDSKQVMKMFFVLLGVSCFLALLSAVGLSVSERADGRMATLGGGPIVFARWMGFGIITLFLLPYKFKSGFKYLMLVTFLILALASGSRGPILALFIIGILYLGLNFNRLIVKVSLGVILISLFILISGVGEKISGVGNFDRVFMNVSKKGGSKQSTSTRANLAIGSLILLQHYPLGVGAGNWQQVSNEIRPTHLMPLEYPHNLFLEVACEYGLHVLFILVLLFIFIIHLSYVKMIKYKDENSLYPLLFYLLIFLSLNSLVSGMLNDSRLLFIIISMVLINKPLIILRKSNG
jgi:O-antigen ligase